MLRFINKNFFKIEGTKGALTLIKTAAFLAGKEGRPSVFAKAFANNSDNDFNRFNDNPISTFVSKVEGKVNLLTITSDARKKPESYSKDVVLVALPFDGLVVGPQEFEGYQILKALCIKSKEGHNVKFNNRKFGNVMYLAIEINKDLVQAEEGYSVTVPFNFYTSHREEGHSVENKWHKLPVEIIIESQGMHVKYGESEFLEDFDINTVKQDGIKVVSPSPRKTLNYK